MTTAHPKALAGWHEFMDGGGHASVLEGLLHDDAVFLSPIVHTPQRGKPIVMAYLVSAGQVLGNDTFRYLNEWWNDRSAILEFETEVEGIMVNGVDMIWWDADGLITQFKVMVRPLKAINMVHGMMGVELQRRANEVASV